MTTGPTMLSQSHVDKALKDQGFYSLMPEFISLQAKIKTIKTGMESVTKKGCGGCRQRRMVANIFTDFLHIVTSLDEDGIQRLKRYFGVDKFMMNVVDRLGKASLKIV